MESAPMDAIFVQLAETIKTYFYFTQIRLKYLVNITDTLMTIFMRCLESFPVSSFHFTTNKIFSDLLLISLDNAKHFVLGSCMKYIVSNIQSVSVFVGLPMMFLSTDFIFENQMRLVTMELICIKFTCWTRDNQQECFKLSNLLSLRCWRRGWTTCLQCGVPLLSLCF